MRRTVERKGAKFNIEDGPLTAWWGFWDLWANGTWEYPLMDIIDDVLPDGGLLLDVGAWVGPVTLWAALRARVVALEPDLEAYRQLTGNLRANRLGAGVRALNTAAAAIDGTVQLWPVRRWGESSSSMTVRKGKSRTVRSVCLAGLLESERPDLVKMDIEGGESIVLPAAGPVLRRHRIPLLLSLHPRSYERGAGPSLRSELTRWHLRKLDDRGLQLYCTTM